MCVVHADVLQLSRRLSNYVHVVMYATYTPPPPLYACSQTHPYSVPLGKAAEKGHTLIVERLLEGGADINQEDGVRSCVCITL